MKIIPPEKEAEGHIYNGDPKTWPPGVYRSQRSHIHHILVAGRSPDTVVAISITQSTHYPANCDLTDGYIQLRTGTQLTIEV